MYYSVCLKALPLLLMCHLLSACGGGGGTDAATSDPVSTPVTSPVEVAAVAGKVFLPSADAGLLTLNGDGNATTYSQTAAAGLQIQPLTWSQEGADLTLASANGVQRLKVSPNATTLTAGNTTYTQALPLSLAALDGKHFVETLAADDACSSRTFSFTATVLTVRERCGGTDAVGEFGLSSDATAEANLVSGVQRFKVVSIMDWGIPARVLDGSSSLFLALQSGDLGSGNSTWQLAGDTNGVLNALKTPHLTAVSSVFAAASDTVTVVGAPVTINVLANDTGMNGAAPVLESWTQGGHGTVALSGTALVYTPAKGFISGRDRFWYTMTDGKSGKASRLVDIHADGAAITAAARQRWNASGLKDYTFTLQRFNYWDINRDPFVVQVKNGDMVSGVVGLGISDLFDYLEENIKRSTDGTHDTIVYATYDPIYGFPTSIYVDWEVWGSDDETGYTISDFRLTP